MKSALQEKLRGIAPYGVFVRSTVLSVLRTPDGISYSGTCLDYKALNQMMKELV